MNGLLIKTAINSLLVLLLFVTSIRAETPAPAKPSVEPRAISILKRMADFLSRTERLSVTTDIEYEAVQENGQKLEFGSIRKITMLRPDKVHVDIEKRDGSKSGLIFDGKDIYVFDVNEKAYATASKRGNLDHAINYFKNKLQMPMPLAELLSSDLPKVISEEVIAGRYVEEAKIGAVECDHLAFRAKNADFQIWIAKGKEPLPHRIVIDYIRDAGRPQFRAQFSDWNLSPDTPDSLFMFKPSKDMERIPFAAVKRNEFRKEENVEGGSQ